MKKSLLILTVLCGLAAVAVAQSGTMLLNAAGATFPYPIYSKWFDVYHTAHSNVQINYQSIGSGGGIQQVTAGTVDFGASDGPMNDDQIKAFKAARGVNILHFPTVLGADVPSYNVPGVSGDLNFTQHAIAGIYLGTITKWNDPEIVRANPGVKLSGDDIVVVHRSDGSGTTYIWTDFLSKASPDWKTKVGTGTSPNWPVGLGGKGNEGVTGLIKQTPGSIGYIELVYAISNNIHYGNVQNAAGQYVKASLASVTAAASGASKDMPDDFRVSITNAPGPASYPVSSFTWLLVPDHFQDAAKGSAVKDFLKWMLTDGQGYNEGLVYAKLPKAVVDKEMKAIALIK